MPTQFLRLDEVKHQTNSSYRVSLRHDRNKNMIRIAKCGFSHERSSRVAINHNKIKCAPAFIDEF